MAVIHDISLGISFVGVAVIVAGVVRSIADFVRFELVRAPGSRGPDGRNQARRDLTSYLLLGLEFLIAADIINTILQPTLKEVAVVGAIVAIRSVLTYFLNLEYRELDKGQ